MKATRTAPDGARTRGRSLAGVLALGTTAALAFSGLVAGPAFADPTGTSTGTGSNGTGAAQPTLSVTPGYDLAPEGDTALDLVGTGYATQSDFGTNFGGAYILFGAVTPKNEADPGSWAPSKGGASGANYDYAAGAGTYQTMVNYPGNETEPDVPYMDADGNWSGSLTIPGARFTSQAGNEIDCTVQQCGVITIGAHGQLSKGVEVFTPVAFEDPSANAVETATAVAAQATSAYPTDFAGQDVVVSATVTPAEAAGAVEFFAGETSLGSADVSGGTATLTTKAFAGGEQAVTAQFTPADPGAYGASASAATTYRIVDLTPSVAAIELGATVRRLSGATLDWSVANYVSFGSAPGKNVVSGDVTLSGLPENATANDKANREFIFTNGTGREDAAGNRVVNFTGTVELIMGSASTLTLADPAVHTNAAGDGYITADTQVLDNLSDPAETRAPGRIVVSTFTGGAFAGDDGSVTLDVTPTFEGQVATGTWIGGYTGATFTNQVLQHINSGVRAFFYQSGTTGANATKPGLPIGLGYALGEEIAAPSLEVTPTSELDRAGADVTVAAKGFDASAVSPWSGTPAGVYVSLGWIANDGWKPSEGAASATRVAVATKWAQESEETGGQYVKWTRDDNDRADFAFAFEDVTYDDVIAKKPEGDYRLAVYTIGAGGVKQAVNESAVEIAFAAAPVDPVDPVESLPFTDVKKGQKFYTEINWLYQEGIATGVKQANGTVKFEPKWNITREATAAYMYRLAGKPAWSAPKVSPFADLKPTDKFYKEITWLADQGITTGVVQPSGKPKFFPKAQITREAMAAFVYRYADSPKFSAPAKSPFADLKRGDKFYKEITWAVDAGVTTGIKQPTGKAKYEPKWNITREAMSAFLYRLDH